MFVTTPDMEHPLPAVLRDTGKRYWDAVKLSTDSPWFLVTLSSPREKGLVAQTVAVAWEATVRDLLESVQSDCVVSIRRLELRARVPGAWAMREIVEVWAPAVIEEKKAGPLIFRFAAEGELRSAFLEPVAQALPGRRLIVRVSS